MKITIRVPDKIGVYKLNRVERQRVTLDLVGRHMRLFNKMREDVSEITLVVDGKSYLVNSAEVDSIRAKMIVERRRRL